MSWDGVERSKGEMHAILDTQWGETLSACTNPLLAISIMRLWRQDKQLIDAGILRVSPDDKDD